MDNIAFTRDPRATRAFFASPRSARAFGARFTFWLNIDYFRAHQRPSVIAHASDGFANNYPPSSTGEQSHRVRVVIARSHRRRPRVASSLASSLSHLLHVSSTNARTTGVEMPTRARDRTRSDLSGSTRHEGL
jgi:hypothetical protein